MSDIKNVNSTIAIGIAGAKSIRYWRRATHIQVGNQISDIKYIKRGVIISITRYTVADLFG